MLMTWRSLSSCTPLQEIHMNIEYRLTIKDHLEANHAHFKSQTSLYYTIWGISLFCIIVGFLCLISGFILTPAELMKKSFFLVLGSILVTLGVFSNPSFNPLRRSEIIRACESQPSIRESRTLEVTEEKLTIKSPSFHSTIDWQSYSHFIETKNLFILY